MSEPHVLLSAYQCAPHSGSVSQIGWEWYSRLSREMPVTLVTHSRNEELLRSAGAPLAGSHILYIDTEWFAGPLYRVATFLFKRSEHAVFLLSSLDFFVFDAVAVRKLRKLPRNFSIAHAVTPVSPLAVTRLHKLGIPLIVGPWNGGITTAPGFRESLRQDSAWIYGARSLGRGADLFARCLRNAARILTATAATDRCLPPGVATERMLENGVDLDFFLPGDSAPPSAQNPLRVLFVGRLIPAKGVDMLLAAVARVRSQVPLAVTIAGNGAIRPALERQVKEERLSDIVTFAGQVNRAQIAALMRDVHLFCLPSIRESGGAVILEAMASALPVLTVAHGGPGELVDEEIGRALTASTPESLIEGMAATLLEFYQSPEDWKRRGCHGRRRAEAVYGWPGRIQRAIRLYGEVIKEQDESARTGKPRSHGAERSSPQHIS